MSATETAAPAPQPGQAEATVPVVEEPQNPLTQKFTEAEWKSLKEFRIQLPDIFAEAYPDNPEAKETPISLWGVDIDPTNPVGDARVSVVLLKFLRARHLNVSEGRSMLVNTLRWRESFDLKAACAEEFPKDVFGGLGKVYGRDKGGRPVVYNIYGGTQDLKAAFGDVQRFIRWRVALMEQSVSQLDFINVDQTLQIHDYEGVSITSRDANSKAAASEATNIFQSHYPELLYHKLFVNVPTLLTWIFWAFKPLISAETVKKMEVVGTGKGTVRRALAVWIDEGEVEGRYR
ncbi:CRAL-TRIO domain-containing protein [Crepidotus variabilis]|uniref:Phosphatidylinositol transfer protein SFH5 n=1 Tax=Crepidotus variabilis TaxID=179855 RepID=A0A9P6JM72_9AGAR|nr:CRAL-TRIO domain-containing protein [Crepidotus variabilis]